jgi:hypothetical protein
MHAAAVVHAPCSLIKEMYKQLLSPSLHSFSDESSPLAIIMVFDILHCATEIVRELS